MQGEVCGISLPSYTSVLGTSVARRSQQSVSFREHRVAAMSSFSSRCDFLQYEGLTGSLSNGKAASRLRHPMAKIGDEAVAGAGSVVPEHNLDLGVEIAHPVGRSSFNGTEISATDARTDTANPMLVVVGHRGMGMNRMLPRGGVPDGRSSIRENTILSFNLAAENGAQFVEFDVQVTKDGVPIIFHDDVIRTDDTQPGRHIGELTLEEFRAIGPQSDPSKVGQPLYRKSNMDGSINIWTADVEAPMCTLKEAFAEVEPNVGFNIEVKFDDSGNTSEEELYRVIDAVVPDVRQYANGRKIYFSTFHPDAAHILRKKISAYPVFFLTIGGGIYEYPDPRRNSVEAAIEVCRKGNLQGIVSEVRAVVRNPACVALVKAEGLYFFTYGLLNNDGETVLKQEKWGIDGVIVDHVLEVVRVARHMDEPTSTLSAPLAQKSVSVE